MNENRFDANILNDCTEALVCALKYRDKHTQLHSQRVITLAEALGKACDLSDAELKQLKVGACFHDIGKIGIEDRVLLKPGRLDSEDWALMKTHPIVGENIVNKLPIEDGDKIAESVRNHHEHFDGSGYPDGLSGEQIPILARIILLADSFDAMTETRPYHQAKTNEQALRLVLQEKGKNADPYLVDKFVPLINASNFRAR